MKRKIKMLTYLLSPIPLFLGFVGYYFLDGGVNGDAMNVFEAFYASAALYFVNPVSDNRNVIITLAQILALLVTASVVLTFVTSLARTLSHLLDRLHSDSTAVYSDTLFGKKLASTLKHGYLCDMSGRKKIERTKDHIILFDNDNDNVAFYQQFRESFEKKNSRVFVGLHHVDTSLMNRSSDNLHYFCLDEIIARDFWKKNNIYDEVVACVSDSSDKVFRIGFIGYGTLGKALLKQAYLTNIFCVDQKIEYHIWGGDSFVNSFLDTISTENDDRIILHENTYQKDFNEVLTMNRIIVPQEDEWQVAQDLLLLNYTHPIYCYSDDETDFSSIFFTDNVHVFGSLSELLTESNIKTEKLFEQARLVNYSYNQLYGEEAEELSMENYRQKADEQWNKLDGFTKGSNTARADYWWIEKRNAERGVPEAERSKMEHIRWCRYHYYNGWKYAPGMKNMEQKTHPSLVPFEQLSIEEKNKDRITNAEIKKAIEELI